MSKKIVQKEHPVLHQKATDVLVEKIQTPEIQELLKDMTEALSKESDGVALAAPQIAEPFRIFMISPLAYEVEKYPKKDQHVFFINPKILKISNDKKLVEEGCLSVRPLYGKVRRASRATIEAYDENGQKFQMEGVGMLAQIFQHEVDHLNGVLFIDKAKEVFEMQ
jgi:peptide deformylase